VRRPALGHLQHLQALAQVTDPAVDLAQLLLAVAVLGILAAVAFGRRRRQGLDHVRPAPAPELLELGAQAFEPRAGDDCRGFFPGRSPAGHAPSSSWRTGWSCAGAWPKQGPARRGRMIPKRPPARTWIIGRGERSGGSGMSLVLWVLLAVVLAWGVFVFNRLVRLRNQVRAGWSDIDVQLMRRHDLVPRLVEAVRAYAGHEKALLENVAELRGRAMASRSPAELAGLEASLEQGLGRLFLLQEAYPDLKASENFLALQRDLVEVEDHLQYARR